MLDKEVTDLLTEAERGIEALLSSEENGNSEPGDREQLDLRIELGRTRLPPEDVQKLRGGSVVSLDGPIGEPAAIYAAGRLIGRGEVVAVEGKIGVRVVELLGLQETT
jgi:flagellar motor switch protein FliN